MSKIEGKYAHERNESFDEYLKAIGVPYIGRKMMCSTSPSLEIKQENDEWTITQITLLRTVVLKFKLGEEYEETMPGGVLKNTTILEDNKLRTNSIGPEQKKLTRIYESTETGCVVILKAEESGVEARRHFKRV